MILREELKRTAESLIRESAGWTGDLQFQIIEHLLARIATIYFSSDHLKANDHLEALGFLVELLETISQNLSQSTLIELHLTQIRLITGKIICHELYATRHAHSSIIDRKLDRILMQFWQL